jgi:GntR family transcriptional regulator, transcriptional repressor for pyruvate dehydrogenase complex
MPKPKKQTAADKLITELEKAIHNGEFKPGSRLPSERDIHRKFGMARGTIRVALSSLKEKGLIKIRPGGGAYVQVIDVSLLGETLSDLIRHRHVSFQHLIEFREAFEHRSVAYAVERSTQSQIDALRTSVDELEKYLVSHKADTAFYRMEFDLHVKLAKMSGNPLFEWLAIAYQKNTVSYPQNPGAIVKRMPMPEKYPCEVIEDWRQLVNAIEKKETLRAIMIIEKHHYQFSRFVSAFNQPDNGAADIHPDNRSSEKAISSKSLSVFSRGVHH